MSKVDFLPIILFVTVHCAFGAVLGWLAVKWKNRGFRNWFGLGFLVFIPAFIVLLFLPKIPKMAEAKDVEEHGTATQAG